MELEEICELLCVDSLTFLTVPDLREAIGVPEGGFCDACMTNDYPHRDRGPLRQLALEKAPPTGAMLGVDG